MHDLALPPAKRQQADDPALSPVVAYDPPLAIMQRAAIAEHLSAFGNGDEVAKRGDAVLQGHRALLAGMERVVCALFPQHLRCRKAMQLRLTLASRGSPRSAGPAPRSRGRVSAR